MTKLLQLLPQQGETTAAAVIGSIHCNPPDAGSKEARTYCAELSKLLLANPEARNHPELQALGFWLRPASVDGMLQKFLPTNSRRPAGVVFQLPPSNVASLFGYASSIALLCGNAVIIRLPGAEHPVQKLLVMLMQQCMEKAPASLRERLIILRYNHNDAITAQLSSVSDTRMVWGSDETVTHIAGISLPAGALHVSFGDRFSAAAIGAEGYLSLGEAGRDDLIKKLFNDIYVFDQLACSSPRLLAWVGAADTVEKSAEDFYRRLSAYAALQGYRPAPGESMAKLNASFLALHDLQPAAYKVFNPSLSVITLPSLENLSAFKSVNYGYGMMLAARVGELTELAAFTEHRDQTLVCACLEEEDIERFTAQSMHRGFNRIVSAGQALTFDPIWDGCNMFDAMTRPVGA